MQNVVSFTLVFCLALGVLSGLSTKVLVITGQLIIVYEFPVNRKKRYDKYLFCSAKLICENKHGTVNKIFSPATGLYKNAIY